MDNIIRSLKINFNLDPSVYDLKLTDSWGSIYKEGDYTISHTHDPAYLSFVYYLTDSPNTPLIFPRNNLSLLPKVNDLIIFPGNLFHEVPQHKGKDRVIIAGNATAYIKIPSWTDKFYTLKK